MSFLPSSAINIFPIGDRTTNTQNRLLSEDNLTNVFKGLASKPSYVLDYDTNHNIKFVIGGYYVQCDVSSIIGNCTEDTPHLYATINITGGSITGTDNGTPQKYEGVTFSVSSNVSDNNSTNIHLLTRTETNGVVTYSVPEKSYFKHSGRDVYITADGAETSLTSYITAATTRLEDVIEDQLAEARESVEDRLKWKLWPSE